MSKTHPHILTQLTFINPPHIPTDPSSQKSPLLYLHSPLLINPPHIPTDPSSQKSPLLYLHSPLLINPPHIPTHRKSQKSPHNMHFINFPHSPLVIIPHIYLNNLPLINSPHIPTTTTTTSLICMTINTYSVGKAGVN